MLDLVFPNLVPSNSVVHVSEVVEPPKRVNVIRHVFKGKIKKTKVKKISLLVKKEKEKIEKEWQN